MFFLDSGGACHDATTCAFLPEDPAYDWNVQGDDPSQPVYGGLVAVRLPDAEVTVLGGQSGHVPDDPDRDARFLDRWGAYDTMPDCEVDEGLTARDWGPRRFWIQAGLHDPELVLARFDYGRRSTSLRSRPSGLVDWVDAFGTWQQ